MPGLAQAVVNLEGLIEVRIVDEPLPTKRSAWLFKVNAHHDAQLA